MATSLVGAGLTGSYIFSQTVFSLRGGVTTRLEGFVIAGVYHATLWVALPTLKHRTPLKPHTLQ